MRVRQTLGLYGIALFAALTMTPRGPAQTPAAGKGEVALRQAAAENRTTYVLFHREWDAAAESLAQVVKTHVGKNAAKAVFATVNIVDPAEKAVVDRFQVSRAPMPLVLAVHPNGAVTGVFVRQAAEADLPSTLVSPKKAECMKALQQNQLVMLCTQGSAQPVLPPGVLAFQADPHFAQRTTVVNVQLNDPNEAGFLAELRNPSQAPPPAIVFMAPPGVLIGNFAATASKDEMAAALGAAGKCCNDPNCKHNHR